MTAILILLGILSISVYFSQQRAIRDLSAVSFQSVLLVLGFCFSGEGLIPILNSTRDSLTPAVRVALVFVAFFEGIRHYKVGIDRAKLLSDFRFTALFFTLLGLGLWFVPMALNHAAGVVDAAAVIRPFSPTGLVVTSLIFTTLLFGTYENLLFIAVIAYAVVEWTGVAAGRFGWIDIVAPVLGGSLIAIASRLILNPKEAFSLPAKLGLGGVCTLAAGWAWGMGFLEVLLGYVFGWLTAILFKTDLYDDQDLRASEYSFSLAIAFVSGLHLSINVMAVLVGTLVALTRLATDSWFFARNPARGATLLPPVVPFSWFALPVGLSLHLSPLRGAQTHFLLTALAAAFISGDVLTLLTRSWFSSVRERRMRST